jgi:hypothetical protein
MYFPLDAEDLAAADALLHVAEAPGEAPVESGTVSELGTRVAAGLAELVSRRKGVTELYVEYDSDAPESNWGNYFFYLGDDRYRPFATVVIRDMPGFDEESRLDRPDAVRLNLHVGRDEFERRFGFAPRDLRSRRTGFDFSAADEVLPHPLYGAQGWVCVLNPDRSFSDVLTLITLAHANAVARSERRTATE